MSENLKVNSNSSVLEHKRKHNLLVDAVPTKDTDGNYKIFENIVDSQGHKRFDDGDIALVEGVNEITKTYGKWSLSGTHLLIVFCGSMADTTVWTNKTFAIVNLPDWIKDKIVPVHSGSVIEQKTLFLYGGTAQSATIYLEKSFRATIIIWQLQECEN